LLIWMTWRVVRVYLCIWISWRASVFVDTNVRVHMNDVDLRVISFIYASRLVYMHDVTRKSTSFPWTHMNPRVYLFIWMPWRASVFLDMNARVYLLIWMLWLESLRD